MFKCLSVCQPYADLILLPETDRRHKRTENRVWWTGFKGTLLIHASKSRSYLCRDDDDGKRDVWGFEIAAMQFGAILGVVNMVACYSPARVRNEFPKLREHPHIEGPHCFVFDRVRRFDRPVPWTGARGLFNVPSSAVEKQLEGWS